MDKSSTIKELLAKFKENTLLPEEKGQLLAIIKMGDNNPDLMKAVEEQWNKEASSVHEIPTELILDKLLHKIKEDQKNETPVNETPVVYKQRGYFRSFLKYAAIIVVTSGITWLINDLIFSNKTPYAIANGDLKDYEVHVPYGSKTKIGLPDGTVVTLNSGSFLRYPARFDSVNRYAEIEGEAFFDVKEDVRNPFIVKTSEITIKVLGTKFNVKSYTDEKTVETTLISGSIEIYKNGEPTIKKNLILVLKPHQQAIYEKLSGDISIHSENSNSDLPPLKPIQVRKKPDLDPVISWKDNRMIFRDESFSELAKKFERWYNVEIEIQNKDLSNALFSGIFENETIEQALNALKIATPFEYKMNKNKIIIYK